MRVEVDQSGKFERTQNNTVLAFSNRRNRAVMILGVEKRECLARVRARGEAPADWYLRLFSAALFLLLKDYLREITDVVIDAEYAGHEEVIQQELLRFIRRAGLRFSGHIRTERIGKHSPAHAIALSVYRKKRKPDEVLRARDLSKILFGE